MQSRLIWRNRFVHLLLCLGAYIQSVQALSLPLEHAFHSGPFSSVGRLESPPKELREGPPHLEIKRSPFTAEQRAAFEELVSTDGYYRLRLLPAEGLPIMTAIKARCLAGSRLQEAFEAHLDVSGHVIALTWSTPTGSCGPGRTLPSDWSFAGVQRVPTRMPARGPSLHPSRPAFSDPGQAMAGPSFLSEQQSGAGDSVGAASRGAGAKVVTGKDGKPIPQPEKTWLQKNWLLVMIGAAVVLNVISNANGAQPAEGASRTQSRPAAATAR